MGLAAEITWTQALARGREESLLLVDVRSPGEFRQGSVPGAVNVPLLTDEHRAAVGTCYKQVGRREAVDLGLELFGARAGDFTDGLHAAAAGGRPLAIYCWRGGMRSDFSARFAAVAGLNSRRVTGGYKEYRQHVLEAIGVFSTRSLVVLDGRTGSGKTEFLQDLARDIPALDLEHLARHRGSAFGDFAQPEPCPSQQDFENRLALTMADLSGCGRVLVEIENFIGPVAVPLPLRSAILSGDIVLVDRDFDDRVDRLVRIYAPVWAESDDVIFEDRCRMLKGHVSNADLEMVVAAVRRRDFRTAVAGLLRLRYDRVYDKGIKRRADRVIAQFNLTHEYAAARAFCLDLINKKDGRDPAVSPGLCARQGAHLGSESLL